MHKQYLPCKGIPNSEEHYKQLIMAISSITKHNALLTENSKSRYIYHNPTNSNGKPHIDYFEEANMLLINTHFRKRVGKLCTFMSDSSGIKTGILHTYPK